MPRQNAATSSKTPASATDISSSAAFSTLLNLDGDAMVGAIQTAGTRDLKRQAVVVAHAGNLRADRSACSEYPHDLEAVVRPGQLLSACSHRDARDISTSTTGLKVPQT
jgi:hypothetical protein